MIIFGIVVIAATLFIIFFFIVGLFSVILGSQKAIQREKQTERGKMRRYPSSNVERYSPATPRMPEIISPTFRNTGKARIYIRRQTISTTEIIIEKDG